ncbi:MAG: MFS transporter [Acidobacteria bacterium]|nr:MFS transporter [Acidobacteriota bacterium]
MFKWRTRELIVLLLIAGCIRAPLTSISPQINRIRDELGISISLFGFLTTIPVICFALAAPLPYTKIFRKISNEFLIVLSLTVLGIATIVRSIGNTPILFLATIILGIAIAILNVVTPAMVRRDYPFKITSIMPIYSALLALVASAAAGFSIPISKFFNNSWRIGISIWAILPLLTALLWIPVLLKAKSTAYTSVNHWNTLLKSSSAWMVTIYMGLQSTLFYVQIAWLPKILMDQGYGETKAGALLGFTTFSGFIFTFALPLIFGRGANQKFSILLTALPGVFGFAGVHYLSTRWTIPSLILISATHAALPVALALIAMKSPTPEQTGHLSAMAQGIGYGICALFPAAFGLIYQATNSWTIAINMLIAICLIQAVIGLRANR